MSEDTRFFGPRSRLVKSVNRAGMAAALDPKSTPATYHADLAKFCAEFDVPKIHRDNILEDVKVWAESLGYSLSQATASETATEVSFGSAPAQPETPPYVEPDLPSSTWVLSPDELAKLFLDDVPPVIPRSDPSPFHRVVREYADALKAACTARDLLTNVPFLCKPVIIEGYKVYAISTWRLRSESDYAWNITGKPAETEGNFPVLHKCDEDILLSHNGVRVCASEDLKLVVQVPTIWRDSATKGSVHQVSANLFIWLLHYVPKRQFRFWVNEETPKAARGKDAYNWRFIMPPAFPL